jgi:hypothetical protein
MHHITLNIYQFVLLLTFIYVFSYHWTPKPRIDEAEEYSILLEKYNKTLAILKKKTRRHADDSEQIVVGKQLSAHAHSIKPSSVCDTDNEIVEDMLR